MAVWLVISLTEISGIEHPPVLADREDRYQLNALLQLDRLAEGHRLFDDHGLVGQLQQPNAPDQVLTAFAFLIIAGDSDLQRALTLS